MEVTKKVLDSLIFRSYQKTAPVRARLLTDEDYVQRQGMIQSLEGQETFQPGDCLAQGVLDEEWIMSRDWLMDNYEQVEGPNEDGFATYYPKPNVRLACQMAEPFVINKANGDILTGKTGDYLILTDDRGRIVDKVAFERSHELLSE
jgi:hypothetical protein